MRSCAQRANGKAFEKWRALSSHGAPFPTFLSHLSLSPVKTLMARHCTRYDLALRGFPTACCLCLLAHPLTTHRKVKEQVTTTTAGPAASAAQTQEDGKREWCGVVTGSLLHKSTKCTTMQHNYCISGPTLCPFLRRTDLTVQRPCYPHIFAYRIFPCVACDLPHSRRSFALILA